MRRLAVLNGDFTLEAAMRVVGVGEGAAPDVVLNLASLVAKSLVAADVGGPVSHYRLQETMRAYAMEKLMGSGEFDAVASRHDGGFADRFDRAGTTAGAGPRADAHDPHTHTAKQCPAGG
jgi:predicted ATPase